VLVPPAGGAIEFQIDRGEMGQGRIAIDTDHGEMPCPRQQVPTAAATQVQDNAAFAPGRRFQQVDFPRSQGLTTGLFVTSPRQKERVGMIEFGPSALAKFAQFEDGGGLFGLQPTFP
jgi:hypothetical protein